MADETKKLTGAAAAAAAQKAAKEAAVSAAGTETAGDGNGQTPPDPDGTETAGNGNGQTPPDPDGTETAGDGTEDASGSGNPVGKTLADKLKAIKESKNPKGEAGGDPYKAIAARYAKSYPNNKVFYITEDKQVFLADHEADARRHQSSLAGGEVHTITVK